MGETKASPLVFNVQHYSLHDGPGIRTIVFLKGCPLRCRWCANPESQRLTAEVSYTQNNCLGKEKCGLCAVSCPAAAISWAGGKAHINRSLCTGCLGCARACPSEAIKAEGRERSVKELLDMVERDGVFYRKGQGGLTVSGGEPLTHPDFLEVLLSGAKARRLSTAIETCGFGSYDALRRAARHLDTVLFDVKCLDSARHREQTGQGNERILENFERLCADFPDLPKLVRTPVIPGFNDSVEELTRIRRWVLGHSNASHEFLPYHRFGEGKYKALGRPYPLGEAALSDEILRFIGAKRKVI